MFHFLSLLEKVGGRAVVSFGIVAREVGVPNFGRMHAGTEVPVAPIELGIQDGSLLVDIHEIYGEFGGVISGRCANAFRKNGITGWRSYPVLVGDWKGKSLVDYEFLVVVGRSGAVLADGVVERSWRNEYGGVSVRWRGYQISKEDWDGSDLFMSSNAGVNVFASQRVVETVREFELEGFDLIPLESTEWSHRMDRGGNPGTPIVEGWFPPG